MIALLIIIALLLLYIASILNKINIRLKLIHDQVYLLFNNWVGALHGLSIKVIKE